MIKIVYPKSGHETSESSSFLLGSISRVEAAASLKLNGDFLKLSPQGFFSWKVVLASGENKFQLQAFDTLGQVLAEKEVIVIQTPPQKTISNDTLAVSVESMRPRQAMALAPGQWFQVSCLASSGAKLSVTIPGILNEPVVLRPYSKAFSEEEEIEYIDNREAVFGELYQGRPRIPAEGYYEGSVILPYDAAAVEHASIYLNMHHPNGDSLMQVFESALSIWRQPKSGLISPSNPENKTAIVRTGPSENAARLTPQLTGTSVVLDGQVGHWYRVRLAGDEVFWIKDSDIEILSDLWIPRLTVRQITTRSVSPSQAEIVIPLREKIPFGIQSADSGLTLSLYGAESHCDVIRLDSGQSIISDVQWKQGSESRVDIQIDCPKLAGYQYDYTDEGLVLRLKTLPENPRDCVILIDAGHGGEEWGAIGPNGLEEKTLNLLVAEQLISALKKQGFQHVFSTRAEDAFVSLDARTEAARLKQADLLISLHHNALPDGREPLEHQGVSCYYYHPFSKKLASELQQGLAQGLSVNNYGLFYDSLAMTRSHESLSVLVELGFFTHPEDFERLIAPESQAQATSTLASLIHNFLSS